MPTHIVTTAAGDLRNRSTFCFAASVDKRVDCALHHEPRQSLADYLWMRIDFMRRCVAAMLLPVVVGMAACRFSTDVTRYGPVLAPTKADEVRVYYGELPRARPYDIIGRVIAAADVMQVDEDRWNGHFRHEAAKLGGDAVLFTSASIGAYGATGYQVGSAIAVVPTTISSRVAYVIKWRPTAP